MRLELKTFQTISARTILTKLEQARNGVRDGDLEAVVLSAPTGSGKTITVAAVIDWFFGGTEGFTARPNTTFLWLSDSPELNAQSIGKLMAACDHVPFNCIVPVESASFDAERLTPGNIYFINTQLLGKDKLLTKTGDRKAFTFWQTVANTIQAAPQDFMLIIDEAHRGAEVTDKARKPIMQKFITGSEADGLPPVPIVLGMSATPQRFQDLLGNTSRIHRPVTITPEMVRDSGLLKDSIIVKCPKTAAHSDLTMLENAATKWKMFWNRWDAYSIREKEKDHVRPILVVQVEDGNETTLTKTPLNDVVQVIERQTGPLALNEIVHCFQDKEEIEYGGRIIRKIEASRIQDTREVKVVLFKTALTTGWDCPRAEVMMSFRRAQDTTSIAQLIGRMIRTPLARRIDKDEVLNTVELFLPHYDADSLEAVLKKLRSPDEHDGVPTTVITEAVEYYRDPRFEGVWEHLEGLPTYSVNRAPKLTDLKRALRLSSMLTHDGIDADADEKLRELLTGKLKQLRDKMAANEKEWFSMVKESGEIAVDELSITVGPMHISGRGTSRMTLSSENIDQLFDEAGRVLASGEGLHRSYWRRYHNHEKPAEAKLEVAAVVRHADTKPAMDALAKEQFHALFEANKSKIKKLPEGERARYHQLQQASGKAEAHEWSLPDYISEKPGADLWDDHLFIDDAGKFSATLNTWEKDFLDWAKQQPGFVGWLRNLDRRPWAFCVPYELGTEKPFYPDFVIVRKKGKAYEIDLLEPHDDSRTDTWAKVKGLAKFADEHGMEFGGLYVGRKKDGKLQVVNVADHATREKARRMTSPNDLAGLFAEA